MAHVPVLAQTVGDLLVPVLGDGGIFVDSTIGRGGHASRLLDAAPASKLVGVDRDPDALEACRADLARFGSRVELVRGNFKDLASILERLGITSVRGVLLDFGVSSPQLDEADRGFSFRADGPLDMRMDTSQPRSAHDVVNGYAEADLARVLFTYGEERHGRRIARAIVRNRPIDTTTQLAEVVSTAMPGASRRSKGHPARRTFQAIRIEVNDEMTAIEQVLPAATEALSVGGRMVAISYHSLEDRIVKRYLAEQVGRCVCPPKLPVCSCGARASLRVLTRGAVKSTETEVAVNPRAASARLRAAEKLQVGRLDDRPESEVA